MRLVFFDDFRLGLLKGDSVVDVSDAVEDVPHTGAHDVINGVIARFADYRPRLERAAAQGRGSRGRPRSCAWPSTTWRTAPAPSPRRSTPS